ncbi:hypothetical protein BaRGS_00013111 [Batillaria attramentaria]|uniref:Uncharacterized protein n=1 Tax=Batillaria attramentaria TaxID=370345 RepID=A0ABD0L8C9_9CAEN
MIVEEDLQEVGTTSHPLITSVITADAHDQYSPSVHSRLNAALLRWIGNLIVPSTANNGTRSRHYLPGGELSRYAPFSLPDIIICQ